MIQNFSHDDKVNEIVCGIGHTMAITSRGKIYSWGEGFKGKLGLGFSEVLRDCKNIDYPKLITRGMEIIKEKDAHHTVKHVGCGKSMSLILQERGMIYMCGKFQYQKMKYDDYRRFSMPYQIFEDVHV